MKTLPKILILTCIALLLGMMATTTSAQTLYVTHDVAAGLSISTDGGATFFTRTTADGLGSNQCFDAVSNGSTVYVATFGGLSISTDGGATFTNRTTANGLGANFVGAVLESGGTLYAATFGGLSISTDGGNSFVNRTTADGLGSTVTLAVFVDGSSIYVATDGGVSKSTDGGVSFVNTTLGIGASNNVRSVFASGSTVYASTLGGLFKSTDGGTTYGSALPGLGGNEIHDVVAVGSTVYAATNGGLSISTDGGATFVTRTTADGLGANVLRAVFVDGSTVYAATDGGLSISSDGGATFVNRTTANGLGNNITTNVFLGTANQPLVADAGPDDTIVSGNSTVIGGSPTASGGAPPYTYSWTPTTGLNDPNLANPTASPTATTTYTVTVTDASTSTATDAIEVTVLPPVSVSLAQVGTPIIVPGPPKAGLQFQYTITLTNNTTSTQTFDIWDVLTAATVPPVFVEASDGYPKTRTLPAGASVTSLTQTQIIPGPDPLYPPGLYTFTVNVGMFPSRTVQASASFTLNKTVAPTLGKSAANLAVPEEFALQQNHPNPFNPSTTIAFDVPEASEVKLAIYNMRGQLIQTLHSGVIAAGRHSVVWNGTDFRGAKVASGVYLYRLEGNGFVLSRKLTFMK